MVQQQMKGVSCDSSRGRYANGGKHISAATNPDKTIENLYFLLFRAEML
jgi:hypothetical protein